MRQLTNILEGFGSTLILLFRSAGYVPTLPRQFGRFVEQCYMIGYTTLPIVALLSFFIGSVLALQAGYSMENFGAKQFIGTLVGVIDSSDQVPYVLLGFGKHTAPGMGLFLDVGVAFMGEPDFQLDAEGGSLNSQSGPLRTALDTEEQEFEDDAGAYLRYWPILNLGFRIGVG